MIRPTTLGERSRVAVVMPTNTWQAYNFRDSDGNGWGDTWYAKGAQSTAALGRMYIRRGVPPQWRKYDVDFIRWLHATGKQPEILTETDLESIRTAEELISHYDFVVFPGHTEYVTRHEYDLMRNYRDLGGNLAFLSANNFFWQVQLQGRTLRRTRLWRDIGRPESSLLGVQYRGNDDGRRSSPYIVRSASTAPWFWAGTGLGDGATFGQELGGYGIEIDADGVSTPPGTIVLAEIPDVFGPGLTAQMTYYETPQGAKVFAGGVIDFGGSGAAGRPDADDRVGGALPAVRRVLRRQEPLGPATARRRRAIRRGSRQGSVDRRPPGPPRRGLRSRWRNAIAAKTSAAAVIPTAAAAKTRSGPTRRAAGRRRGSRAASRACSPRSAPSSPSARSSTGRPRRDQPDRRPVDERGEEHHREERRHHAPGGRPSGSSQSGSVIATIPTPASRSGAKRFTATRRRCCPTGRRRRRPREEEAGDPRASPKKAKA